MSIESKPFYWLACDAPSCKAVHPDSDEDEMSAVGDQDHLLDWAGDRGWVTDIFGKHYCPTDAGTVPEEHLVPSAADPGGTLDMLELLTTGGAA